MKKIMKKYIANNQEERMIEINIDALIDINFDYISEDNAIDFR